MYLSVFFPLVNWHVTRNVGEFIKAVICGLLGATDFALLFIYFFILLEAKKTSWPTGRGWINMHNHILWHQRSAAQRLNNRNPLGSNELCLMQLKHLCKRCLLFTHAPRYLNSTHTLTQTWELTHYNIKDFGIWVALAANKMTKRNKVTLIRWHMDKLSNSPSI